MVRVATGSAATMIGCCASIYLQVNPTFGKDHPHVVSAVYFATFVACCFLLFQFRWFQRLLGVQPIQESPISLSTHTPAPVSNTATADGNRVEQHFHGVAPASPPQREQVAVAIEKPQYPPFHWKFRYARVSGLNGIWRETESKFGYQTLVLDISADMPALGVKYRHCTVYGAIRISPNIDGEKLFLNRLCWIGEGANEMDFEIGKSATLFVLCFDARNSIDQEKFDPGWATFQNPTDRVPDHPFSRMDLGHDGEFGKKIKLPIIGSPVFTVSLIEPRTQRIVDSRTVRLKVEGEDDWKVEDITNED